MKLKLNKVRLSFADLFTARSKFDGEPKFSAMFIVDPSTPEGKDNLQRFKAVVREIEKEKFKGAELPLDKLPIKDGNEKDYDGWQDMMVISSANKKRPVVVGRKRQPVHEGDPEAPYSGCYVNVVLDVWGMDNQYGKRIICSLEAVQFAAEGEPFASKVVDVESDFEDIEEVSADSVFGI